MTFTNSNTIIRTPPIENNPLRKILICLLISALIFILYRQVINYDFINFDDPTYVTENHLVMQGLTPEALSESFSSLYASNWHPLTWISHMIDLELFGMNPGMHHLVNVLFHVMNALLLFLVLGKMSGSTWRSAAVAVLFAVHPLHVESVAWIAERKDVLSAFFWLLTLMGYVRYVRHKSFRNYFLIIVFYILGLASKPMLVTLPFTLLLLDFWPLRRWNPPKTANHFSSAGKSGESPAGLILEKLPLFLLAFISCVITLYAQKDAIKTFELFPWTTRISNAVVSYITYLEKTVWPFDLSIFYPFHDLPPLKVAFSAAALVVISGIVYALRKKSPYLIVGWLWFLGTLIPVIGLVQVGGQSMADKYTYMPLTGLFIMSVWGIADCLEKRTSAKTVLVILSFFPLAFFSAATFHQAGFWKNSETLFQHALAITRDNDIALYDLGISAEKKGDTESAIAYYQEALKINPRLYGARNNLGVLLAGKGKTDESIQHFLAALKSNPRPDDAYYNLGMVYYRNGDIPRAIDCFQKAIRENKNHKKASDMLMEAREKSPK